MARIVSHGHANHVRALLRDLDRHCRTPLEVILTANTNNDLDLQRATLSHRLHVVVNDSPKGFGANHNSAFRQSAAPHFCVLNPDVRIHRDPWPELVNALADESIGVVAPLVTDAAGGVQQSFRRVMTPLVLVRRAIGRGNRIEYSPRRHIYPEWVAGMCMLFRRQVFSSIGGFDERYFLYCEDMDICCRLSLAGYKACVAGEVQIVHEGQYGSRHNLRHLAMHLHSLLLFYRSDAYRTWLKQRREKGSGR